jgi:hypothetical protein
MMTYSACSVTTQRRALNHELLRRAAATCATTACAHRRWLAACCPAQRPWRARPSRLSACGWKVGPGARHFALASAPSTDDVHQFDFMQCALSDARGWINPTHHERQRQSCGWCRTSTAGGWGVVAVVADTGTARGMLPHARLGRCVGADARNVRVQDIGRPSRVSAGAPTRPSGCVASLSTSETHWFLRRLFVSLTQNQRSA